jgi:hypothetical protein
MFTNVQCSPEVGGTEDEMNARHWKRERREGMRERGRESERKRGNSHYIYLTCPQMSC